MLTVACSSTRYVPMVSMLSVRVAAAPAPWLCWLINKANARCSAIAVVAAILLILILPGSMG